MTGVVLLYLPFPFFEHQIEKFEEKAEQKTAQKKVRESIVKVERIGLFTKCKI